MNALAGPSHSGNNPRTGTPWDPSQSVLRSTWTLVCAEIILGWTLPPMEMWIQITGARENTVVGMPNFDPLNPW